MNKAELIATVAEVAGLSKKDSEKAVNATFDAITAALEAGETWAATPAPRKRSRSPLPAFPSSRPARL